MSSPVRSATIIAVVLGHTACKEEVTEPAPVRGGEYLSYQFGGRLYTGKAKVTIEPNGDGYVLDFEPDDGEEPPEVDAALSMGRRMIKPFHIGWIWLPPSKRRIGAELPMAEVTGTKIWNGAEVVVLTDRKGRGGDRFYDPSTGFLVGMEIVLGSGANHTARLTDSNIPGLPPG